MDKNMDIEEKAKLISDNNEVIIANMKAAYESAYNKGAENKTAEIELVLDSILAIQDALIPKKPMFTINDHGNVSTYEFEEGMTWAEWVESEYNPKVNTNYGIVGSYYCSDLGQVCHWESSLAVRKTIDYAVSPDDVIEAGYAYYTN